MSTKKKVRRIVRRRRTNKREKRKERHLKEGGLNREIKKEAE